MFTSDQIKAANLHAHLERLKNKHTGGKNQKKGNSYENFFALYKIVKNAANNNLETKLKDQPPYCFVDDLVIQHEDEESNFYQLKNVKNISWTSKGLLNDFNHQFMLSNSMSQKFNLVLVLSSEQEFVKMLKVPSECFKKTYIKFFPEAHNIEEMITLLVDFKNWLVKLSAKANPTLMDLDYLAKNILSEWIDLSTNDHPISVRTVIAKASKRKSTPIKSNWKNTVQWKATEKILNKIPNFKFSTMNGIFEYWLGEYDNGIIDQEQDNREFKNFEARIIKNKPQTIEEFEELL